MGGDTSVVTPTIIEIRQQRVVIDYELARLYGVPTRRFNEAFRRNRARFPQEFVFQLSTAEFAALRRAQANESSRQKVNRSQNAIGSQRHRDPRNRPWVFTEHGALMAANILRSQRAVQMSVFVIRAFVRLREQAAANSAILKRLAEIDLTLLQHDSALRDVYQKLLPLLQPPTDPPRRRIGFHSD